MSDKLAQTQGLSGALLATHFERCMLTEQSESIVPAKAAVAAGAKCNSALVTCRTRDAMHHFLGQPQNGAEKNSNTAFLCIFCAPYNNKQIVCTFMPFSCVLNDPDFIFGSLSMFVHLLKARI